MNPKKAASWKIDWNRNRRNSSRRMAVENLETRELLAAYITGVAASYPTIQAAVDAANPGATITVGPGTYNESVAIYKPLTLLGNNAGVDARGGGRKAETVVYDPLDAFVVGASGVTINGFTIQGADANVGGGLAGGVYMKPNIHGTQVLDNIIHDNVSGVLVSNNSDTDACVIQGNSFYNNHGSGDNAGRAIYSDGTVSGGLLTNVWIDSNSFNESAGYTWVGAIGLEALGAGKQFNVTVSRNTFSSNYLMSKAILAYNVTNVSLIGNEVSGTQDDGSGAFRFEGNANNVNIQYNNVHNNLGPGIAIQNKVADQPSSNFVVNYNNFYNNRLAEPNIPAGVIYDPGYYTGPFDARYNYWGASNGPSGDGPGSGNGVYGNATIIYNSFAGGWLILGTGTETFSPWLSSAVNISAIPAPAAATGLSATSLSSTSVQLNWTAGYSTAFNEQVQRSADGGKTWTTVATVSPLINSYTDSGLTTSTNYSYRISASNATGSTAGNIISVTPLPYQAPSPPTGLNAVATGTNSASANLSWTIPSYSLGITGYVVYRNGQVVATVPAGTTTYTDSGLASSTAYRYTVATQDNTGATSAPSAAANVVTVTLPAFAFNDGSFETTRVSGYAYTPTTASWTFSGRAGIEANGSVWGAANAPDGTQAAFLQGTGGQGGSVSQAFAVNTPGNFTFSFRLAQRGGYGIEPVQVSVDGKTVGTYTPSSTSFQAFTTGAVTLSAGSHTLTFSTTANNGDNGSFLDTVSVTYVPSSPPASPTNLTAAAISSSQVNITWTAATGGPSSYTLQRSADSGSTWTNAAANLSPNVNSYSDTGLAAGTSYTYRLAAVNAAGSSAPSATASAITLSAAAVKTPLSSLNWTSATSGYKTPQVNASVVGNPITIRNTTYANGIGTHAVSTIVYNIGGKYLAFTGTVGIDDETAVGGAVDFQIIGDGQLLFDSGIVTRTSVPSSFAVNVAGVKTLTLQATNGVTGSIDYDHADWAGVTLLSNPAAPAAPTNLNAKGAGTTPAGSASVTLSWQGDGTQTGFTLQRSSDGVNFATIATPAGSATSYTDTGLTPGSAYTYRITAGNSTGTSPASASASITPTVYQAPAAPTGLTVTGTTTTTASLSWTAVAGAAGYNVYRNGTSLGNVNGTTFSDNGLTPGTSYQYTVAAVDAYNGTSAQSQAVTAATVALPAVVFNDGSFETTRVNGYAYTPTTASWTFSGRAGIEANGSAWGAANAPDGTQAAFLQGNGGQGGNVSQTFTVNTPGNFTFGFRLAQRWNYGVEPVQVSVDGKTVGTYTPSSTSFQAFTTGAVTLSAGSHTLTFSTTANNGDNGSFLDTVSVNAALAAPAAPANLNVNAMGTTSALLTWTPGDTSQTGFKVDRSADNGATWTTIATPTQATYTDTALTPGASYLYRVRATNTVGDSANSATAALTLPSQSTALSSLTPTSAVQGWGSLGINQSVSGNPLTLAGRTYASGLGTHAAGTLTYNLGGSYQSFSSMIGLDDEIGTRTADPVVFQVIGDGKVLYSSPTITGAGQVYAVNISVAGVKTLQLVVVSVNPGSIDYGHADWAGAVLA